MRERGEVVQQQSVASSSVKAGVELREATVRFAGDSGDGMQLAGTQLTTASAAAGNDVVTLPDFPAEIRAPRGTKAGVSGFQVHFAGRRIYTPGDKIDALVAMNPAALATNVGDLARGGLLIVDSNSFVKREWEKAGYAANPLDDPALSQFRIIPVEITELTRAAVKDLGLTTKEADRCRNFFAMGLVYWIFDRPLDPTLRFIAAKFGKRPAIAEANRRVLMAGYHYGETTEAVHQRYVVRPAELPPGTYRSLSGNQALAWGLMAASRLSNCDLVYAGYPITPASDILHELAMRWDYGVKTFQAEDEISAVAAAVGAAFGGKMGVTASSGPGISLKAEGLGLAVMLELPLIAVNVQRAGPSTGLPTKTEQADLLQALFGRHGECPLPVLAPQSPADNFEIAVEAWRIAVRYMTPVMILSDGYLANGAEPWRIRDLSEYQPIPVRHPDPDTQDFLPYRRDERLARPWAVPGTPNLMHRIGGLEKQVDTGTVSYDGANHQKMVQLRAQKVAGISKEYPPQPVIGPERGKVLFVSWGGTFGAVRSAVQELLETGYEVAHTHLRYLNPLPDDLGDILSRYERIVVPELNLGQLAVLLQAKYLRPVRSVSKVMGRPFNVEDLVEAGRQAVEED
ncbi:MAG: 2-oxoacid:acceptor oxidoreductase subunit alpha [Thermogutta sp.]|nr:2-oxoacid:acceptor oxidoreductase subunit alpha [Thermogutta sp.]